MIDVQALASSSSGNSYRISDGKTPLLIECGLAWRQIMEGLKHRTHEIAACLVSHGHDDHSHAVKDMLVRGFPCHMSRECAVALGVAGAPGVDILDPAAGVDYPIGSWLVRPFEVNHDAPGALGFLLASGNERLLYVTDTAYVVPRFAGLTAIMVEANFDLELLRQNTQEGEVDRAVKKRVMGTHMSIDSALELLRANDLARCRGIWLLHLSDNNSNARDFRARVEAETGIPTRIA